MKRSNQGYYLKGKTSLKGQFKEVMIKEVFLKVTINDHTLKYLENAHIIPNWKDQNKDWDYWNDFQLAMVLFGYFFILQTNSNRRGRKRLLPLVKEKKILSKIKQITFKDVAGVDETKERIRKLQDFYANPKKIHSSWW